MYNSIRFIFKSSSKLNKLHLFQSVNTNANKSIIKDILNYFITHIHYINRILKNILIKKIFKIAIILLYFLKC